MPVTGPWGEGTAPAGHAAVAKRWAGRSPSPRSCPPIQPVTQTLTQAGGKPLTYSAATPERIKSCDLFIRAATRPVSVRGSRAPARASGRIGAPFSAGSCSPFPSRKKQTPKPTTQSPLLSAKHRRVWAQHCDTQRKEQGKNPTDVKMIRARSCRGNGAQRPLPAHGGPGRVGTPRTEPLQTGVAKLLFSPRRPRRWPIRTHELPLLGRTRLRCPNSPAGGDSPPSLHPDLGSALLSGLAAPTRG